MKTKIKKYHDLGNWKITYDCKMCGERELTEKYMRGHTCKGTKQQKPLNERILEPSHALFGFKK